MNTISGFLSRLLMLAALVLCGCGGSVITGAVIATNASHDVLKDVHDDIEAMNVSARDDALASATSADDARRRTDAVQSRFKPSWDAYARARLAWLAARAAVAAAEAAEAAGRDLDPASILKAMGAAADAWSALQRALEALGVELPPMPSFGPTAPPAAPATVNP